MISCKTERKEKKRDTNGMVKQSVVCETTGRLPCEDPAVAGKLKKTKTSKAKQVRFGT